MSHETKDTSVGINHPEPRGDSFFLGHDLSLMKAAHAKMFAHRHVMALNKTGQVCENANVVDSADLVNLRSDPKLDTFLEGHDISYELVVEYVKGTKIHPNAVFVFTHEGQRVESPVALIDFESDQHVAMLPESLGNQTLVGLSESQRN